MSAFRWLAFTVSITISAALAAVLNEMVLPTISIARSQSTTQASQQGLDWYSQAWTWMPLMILFLLVFVLIVAIIVRRRGVPR